MRSFQLAITALVAFVATTGVASRNVAQAPFSAGGQPHLDVRPHESPVADIDANPPIVSTPLDVLTSSPDHRIIVRLLQRTRLIPTLLRLIEFDDGSGLTIFAPTDDALRAEAADEASETSIWTRAMRLLRDEDADKQIEEANNIQEHLRQHLLHHMINYTLPYETTTNLSKKAKSESGPWRTSVTTPLPIESPHMHSSLHFPTRRGLHEPSRPGPIPQPPEGPTHPGDEDQGGLLGGEGQKLRMIWRWRDEQQQDEDKKRDPRGSLYINVDAQGRDGVAALREYRTRHGTVVSINGTLALPPAFSTVVRTHPSLSALSALLSDETLHTLSVTAHSTFFLPTSHSFDQLPQLARQYLFRNISQEEQNEAWRSVKWDRTKLAGWHVSGRGLLSDQGEWGRVAYAERLRAAADLSGRGQLTTILGGPLSFFYNASAQDARLQVGGNDIVEEDILTENGVVHIVDSLLLPNPSALNLNVEKTLLALNASRFVTMMRKAGLESYLLQGGSDEPDDTDDAPEAQSGNWTFIVPSDETLKDWLAQNPELNRWWHEMEGSSDEVSSLTTTMMTTKPAKAALRDLLKYHIIPDAVMPNNLTDGGLVATELRNWRLKEGRQRIVTTVSEPQGRSHDDRKGNGDVAFGDANVIADPVIVNGNNSQAVIYLASKLLTPPDNPIQTAVGASLGLSTFVAAVFSAELDKPIKKAPGVTYLIPNNDAFAALGLVMPYLLLSNEQSRDELRKVVEYHSIDEIVYISDFASGKRRYPTLEGSSIWAGRDKNGTIEVRRQSHVNEQGKLNAGRPAKVRAKDLLTSTGVLHEIDQVELPADLSLTSGKLLKGAKCDTFRELVIKAGYGFILNGTAPEPETDEIGATFKSGKKKRDKKHKRRHRLFEDYRQSYILLAPTDQAFARINVTYYLSNPDALQKLVQLHILPSPAVEDEENVRLADMQGNGDRNRLPLGVRDALSLPSLLDKSVGGSSSYGKIAFRDIGGGGSSRGHRQNQDGRGDNGRGDDDDDDDDDTKLGWLLGISGSRGSSSPVADDDTMRHNRRKDRHSAQALNFGRESLAIPKRFREDDEQKWQRSIGGVLTLDSVLIPYEPNWFYRWGWIVVTAMYGLGKGAVFTFAVYKWWKVSHDKKKNRRNMEEAMEGEEE